MQTHDKSAWPCKLMQRSSCVLPGHAGSYSIHNGTCVATQYNDIGFIFMYGHLHLRMTIGCPCTLGHRTSTHRRRAVLNSQSLVLVATIGQLRDSGVLLSAGCATVKEVQACTKVGARTDKKICGSDEIAAGTNGGPLICATLSPSVFKNLSFAHFAGGVQIIYKHVLCLAGIFRLDADVQVAGLPSRCRTTGPVSISSDLLSTSTLCVCAIRCVTLTHVCNSVV